MLDSSDVRKRLLRAIDSARQNAARRRDDAEAAAREGGRVLATVVAPTFRMVAGALAAEGRRFQVSTPKHAVRLTAAASSDRFIEMEVDTARDPPALVGRVSRTWGRQVLVDEHVVCEDTAIATLTEETVLQFVLDVIGPFVE